MSASTDLARDSSTTESGSGRVHWLDLARAAALAAMVVFHFTRDLEMFGVIQPGTTLTGGWALFARLIAGSFIFLSGVSLVLAYGRNWRIAAWARRLAIIVGAALLVSLATYIAFPGRYIYFGILHVIAVSGFLGALFLRWPAWALGIAVLAILALDQFAGRAMFTAPWLAWTGLSSNVRASFDFIPLVPWFGAYLAGMAVARAIDLRRIGRTELPQFLLWCAWLGRHSLVFYLIHQPILLALVWGLLYLL